jgi:hypothetical protein
MCKWEPNPLPPSLRGKGPWSGGYRLFGRDFAFVRRGRLMNPYLGALRATKAACAAWEPKPLPSLKWGTPPSLQGKGLWSDGAWPPLLVDGHRKGVASSASVLALACILAEATDERGGMPR